MAPNSTYAQMLTDKTDNVQNERIAWFVPDDRVLLSTSIFTCDIPYKWTQMRQMSWLGVLQSKSETYKKNS